MPVGDPALEAVVRAEALEMLAGMSEDDRTIVVLVADGHSQQEIGEILGVSVSVSVRAVEGRLRRIRQRYRRGE